MLGIAMSRFSNPSWTLPKLRIGGWEMGHRAPIMIGGHILGIQGFYFWLAGYIPWQYFVFEFTLILLGGISLTAGAHRGFAHRSYKASVPLRIFLMIAHTIAGQESLCTWSRHHRLHHKYCETDGDPHNIKRGIFFTHVGWTLVKEHPTVTENEKKIDMSDLLNDSVLGLQHRYYWLFDLVFFHTIPVAIAYNLWVPSLYICYCANFVRFVVLHNIASLGNSLAHSLDRKPYDKSMGAADVSWLSFLLFGEGWHNFHHAFPWDYRSTDVGPYSRNLTTMFIDLMAKLGLASDLKTVPDHLVRKRAARTGDGSHPHVAQLKAENLTGEQLLNDEKQDGRENEKTLNHVNQDISKLDVGELGPGPWGWGDKDLTQEDAQDTFVTYSKTR